MVSQYQTINSENTYNNIIQMQQVIFRIYVYLGYICMYVCACNMYVCMYACNKNMTKEDMNLKESRKGYMRDLEEGK